MHNLSFCLQYTPAKLIIWIPKLELCWKKKIKYCKNYDSSEYLKVLIICSSYSLNISWGQVSQGLWKRACQMLWHFSVFVHLLVIPKSTSGAGTSQEDKGPGKHFSTNRAWFVSLCLRSLSYQSSHLKLPKKLLNELLQRDSGCLRSKNSVFTSRRDGRGKEEIWSITTNVIGTARLQQ